MQIAFRIEQVAVPSVGRSFVYCTRIHLQCELPIMLPVQWLGEVYGAAEHGVITTVVSTQPLGQLHPEFGLGRNRLSVLTAIGLHRDLGLARLRAWGLSLRCLSAGPTSPDSPACRYRRRAQSWAVQELMQRPVSLPDAQPQGSVGSELIGHTTSTLGCSGDTDSIGLRSAKP